jgi:hypothetical protein
MIVLLIDLSIHSRLFSAADVKTPIPLPTSEHVGRKFPFLSIPLLDFLLSVLKVVTLSRLADGMAGEPNSSKDDIIVILLSFPLLYLFLCGGRGVNTYVSLIYTGL